MATPNEIRVLLRFRGQDRKLAKLRFVEADASIYVVPYAVPGATYFYGEQRWPRGKTSLTFDFTKLHRSSTPPHLSIHETGRTHVRNGAEAGPIALPALHNLAGQHIALVTCSRLGALPPLKGKRRTAGRRRDRVIPVPHRVESGRISIYGNAHEPKFDAACHMRFRLASSIGVPLFIGIACWWQAPLAAIRGNDVVVVMAGWDPLKGGDPSRRERTLAIVAR